MRRFVAKVRQLFQQRGLSRKRSASRRRLGVYLGVRAFEERMLLSANASGVITGTVFVDSNGSGRPGGFNGGVAGITLTLTGHQTFHNVAVDVTATTDSQGHYSFLNVQPGVYSIHSSPSSDFLASPAVHGLATPLGMSVLNKSIAGGQTIDENFSVGGLKPQFFSLRDLMNTATSLSSPFSAGSGQGLASSRPNNKPVVKTAIADLSLPLNSSGTSIDLAGHFSDPDMGNSLIRFTTSLGSFDVTLFDALAPQTVANFYDYINAGDYNNSIFHRFVQNFVLQGGGFQFSQIGSTGSLTAIPTLQPVPNEFHDSNVTGTIAMAKVGGDPNSATDQFFFNLANNSSNLDNQNGGFTVFGKLSTIKDLDFVKQVLLAGVKTVDETSSDGSLQFNNNPADFPVKGSYANNDAKFPTDLTANNLLIIKKVTVLSRPEALTYSIVSNTNANLVTATLTNERLNLSYTANQSGTAIITVQATDKFGATVNETFKVTIKPMAITSETNPVNAANETSASVSGVTLPNASVSLTVTDKNNQKVTATATAGSDGKWSVTGLNLSTLADGTITYTATAQDASGNTITDSQTALKGTVAPHVTISTDTDPVNQANVKKASISGTGDAGDTISVVVGDGTHNTTAVTTKVGTDGKWTISNLDLSSLSDGQITYTVTATDAAGNTTTVTKTATKKTAAPVLTIAAVTNPINASNASNTSISGTADAGDKIKLTITQGKNVFKTLTATADTSGNWSFTGIDLHSLKDGAIGYSVVATDAVGNTTTVNKTVTKDTVAPKVSITSVTNPINSTNNKNASAAGTTEAGATISVTITDGTHTTTAKTATAASDGSWSVIGLDASGLNNGTVTYTIVVTDAAGNSTTVTHTATKS